MKQIINVPHARLKLGILAAAFLLTGIAGNNKSADVIMFHDDINVARKTNIRIFPNPSLNGVLYINHSDHRLKEVQFYVFDLEGTMMHNMKLKEKEKKQISGLKKGVYMYDVFYNDESIDRGKIIVK